MFSARRERLQLLAREWKDRRGPGRLLGLAGWSGLFGFRGLAAPGSIEQRYLRWSTARALVQALVLVTIAGLVGESLYWRAAHDLPLEALTARWAYKLGKEVPLPAGASRSTVATKSASVPSSVGTIGQRPAVASVMR